MLKSPATKPIPVIPITSKSQQRPTHSAPNDAVDGQINFAPVKPQFSLCASHPHVMQFSLLLQFIKSFKELWDRRRWQDATLGTLHLPFSGRTKQREFTDAGLCLGRTHGSARTANGGATE